MKDLLRCLILLFSLTGMAYGQPVAIGMDPQQPVYAFCRDCFADSLQRYFRPHIQLNGIALPIAIPMGVDQNAIIQQTPYGRFMTWFAAFRDTTIVSSPERLQELVALDVQLYLHALIEEGMEASKLNGRRKLACINSGARVLQLVMDQTDLASDWLGVLEYGLQTEAMLRSLAAQRDHIQKGLMETRQLEQNLDSILKEVRQ